MTNIKQLKKEILEYKEPSWYTYKFSNEQKEWLEALESGRFRQGRGCLIQYSPEHKKCYYCCLGVACTLDDKFNKEYRKVKHNGIKDVKNITYAFLDINRKRLYFGFIPEYLRKKLKFRSGTEFKVTKCLQPKFTKLYKYIDPYTNLGDCSVSSLVLLNDVYKFTFKEIAQFIRNNPRKVFRS